MFEKRIFFFTLMIISGVTLEWYLNSMDYVCDVESIFQQAKEENKEIIENYRLTQPTMREMMKFSYMKINRHVLTHLLTCDKENGGFRSIYKMLFQNRYFVQKNHNMRLMDFGAIFLICQEENSTCEQEEFMNKENSLSKNPNTAIDRFLQSKIIQK